MTITTTTSAEQHVIDADDGLARSPRGDPLLVGPMPRRRLDAILVAVGGVVTVVLQADGRDDLIGHAGQQVTTGAQAEADASYIAGRLAKVADGATYVDQLQAEADTLTGQRNTLFKGETLRGLLLSTYAWSTVGMIAGIAAIAAFVAAVMAILVAAGVTS